MKTLGYQAMKEISVNFNNVMKLEALVNYALTLHFEGTVNLWISRMGEGMTEIKTREHPDEIAKKRHCPHRVFAWIQSSPAVVGREGEDC